MPLVLDLAFKDDKRLSINTILNWSLFQKVRFFLIMKIWQLAKTNSELMCMEHPPFNFLNEVNRFKKQYFEI